MKILSGSDYIIRILLYMSSNKKITLSGKDIVTTCHVPEKLGLRILTRLSSTNLLHSIKGINGGFSFIRSPESISLLDIIKIFDNIKLSRCIDSLESCNLKQGNYVVYKEFKIIRDNLIKKFASISLKYLIKKENSN